MTDRHDAAKCAAAYESKVQDLAAETLRVLQHRRVILRLAHALPLDELRRYLAEDHWAPAAEMAILRGVVEGGWSPLDYTTRRPGD